MLIAKVTDLKINWQHPEIARKDLLRHEGEFVMVSIKNVKKKRSLPQNRVIHSIVRDFAEQIEYPEGSGVYRSSEDWKDLLAAAVISQCRELEIVPVPESDAVVVLGLHTSDMTTKEMTLLIEYAHSYGAKRGVEFSPTSL